MIKKASLFLVAVLSFSACIAVFCPICKTHADKFTPGGAIVIRENSRCTCNSLERHRHMWLFLKNECPKIFSEPGQIIAVMPESGIDKLFSSLPHISYTSYQPPVKWQWGNYADQLPWPGKKHIEYLKKPIEGLKYAEKVELDVEDNSIDGVVCCHALPLIRDDKQALKEILRVLKPGGWALCMIPLDYSRETTYEDFSALTDDERLEKFGQPDKLRKYGRDFPQLLRSAGFQVKIAYLKDVPQKTREYYGIDGYDDDPAANEMRGADIFFCTKPHKH